MYKKKKRIIFILLLLTLFMSIGQNTITEAKSSSSTQWVCVKKKVKTKKSKKKPYTKKQKKKASKTKTTTKTKKISSKTKSKISKDKKIKTKTITKKKLVTKNSYKKGSKTVKISETIVTETITYTYKKKSKQTSEQTKSKTSTPTERKSSNNSCNDLYTYPTGIYDIATLAPLANDNIIKAFKNLGMICKIDPTCTATGVFNVTSRTLTLKYYGDHIYHELGHFLFFVAGSLDITQEANSIYRAEMGNVTAYNRSYTNSSVKEYFAEAYLTYLTDKNTLKKTRPRTYAYIENAIKLVTDEQVRYINSIYKVVWE